jgi:hypothetical protein
MPQGGNASRCVMPKAAATRGARRCYRARNPWLLNAADFCDHCGLITLESAGNMVAPCRDAWVIHAPPESTSRKESHYPQQDRGVAALTPPSIDVSAATIIEPASVL